MKFSRYLLLLILISSCTSGKNEDTSPVVLNLDTASDARPLDLESVLSDIRMVKLETNDSVLLPEYVRYAITDDYIVVITQQAVFQFNRDGSFLRKLLTAGRGPGEFRDIYAFATDPGDHFYYFHVGDLENINAVDLVTGKHTTRIAVPNDSLEIDSKIYLERILYHNDILYCVPWRHHSEKFLMYAQKTTGEYAGHIPRKNEFVQSNAWVGQGYLNVVNNQVFFKESESDTIFHVDQNMNLIPAISITYTNKLVIEPDKSVMSGEIVSLSAEGPVSLFLVSSDAEIRRYEGGSVSARSGENRHHYYANKLTSEVTEISDLIYTELGITLKNKFWHNASGQAAISIQAADMIEMIDEALDQDTLSPQKRQRLTTMKSGLNENDNPILITGTIK